MDIFPKFIIETDAELGDCLIIAKCTYHKDLVMNKEKVKGGGRWILKDKTFILYGDSHDFGKAKLDDIESCIIKERVFTNPFLTNTIAKRYTFAYDTGTEILILPRALYGTDK
jgi:hypothetical protein